MMANIPLLPNGVANANVYNVLPSYLMGFIKNAVSHMRVHMRVWVTCVVSCAIILHTVMRFLSELQQVYKLAQSRVIIDIEKKSLKMDKVADKLIQQIETYASADDHPGINPDEMKEFQLLPFNIYQPTATHLSNMNQVILSLNTYVKDHSSDSRAPWFKWLCVKKDSSEGDPFFKCIRAVIKDIIQQEQSDKCSAGIQARNEKVVNAVIELLSDQRNTLSKMMEIGKFGCIAVCSSNIKKNKTSSQRILLYD